MIPDQIAHVIQRASQMLSGEADTWRACNVQPDGTWEDKQDRKWYDEMIAVAAGLRDAADALDAARGKG